MSTLPSAPSSDGGRDPTTGRFLPGNKVGKGNPHAQAVNRLRSALLRTVKSRDVQDVARALLEKARQGDTAAAKLLLDYCIGRPIPTTAGETGSYSLIKVLEVCAETWDGL